jgi:hypothetical protein
MFNWLAILFGKRCEIVVDENYLTTATEALIARRLNHNIDVMKMTVNKAAKIKLVFRANRKQYDTLTEELKSIHVMIPRWDTFGRKIYLELV